VGFRDVVQKRLPGIPAGGETPPVHRHREPVTIRRLPNA
jgi:hypothetical protein